LAEIHADIDALKGFRDALTRFRLEQRVVIARGDQEIEKTRASLEAKARRWRAELERRKAALAACRRAGAAAGGGPYGWGGPPGYARGGYAPDCSGLARDVAEAQERLKHIRIWQRKVDQEAAAFRGAARRFRAQIENETPRAEAHLLAIVNGLEAARGIKVFPSVTPAKEP
jgi:hypothetical protein